MAAFDLTTLAGVREFMEVPSDEHGRDYLIEALISAASKAIMKRVHREFAPPLDAVEREFPYDPGTHFLDFVKYDARSITSVKDESDTTLDAKYWRPWPVGGRNGVYTGMRLWLPTANPSDYFPERIVSVTADWGFEEVPEDIAQACTLAVALWLRRDVSTFATTLNLDTGRYERPEALPAAVLGLLDDYERGTYT